MADCLVDTSVWIDFFRGRLKSAFRESFSEMIIEGLTKTTPVIRHEILVGTKTESEFRAMQEHFENLDCLEIEDQNLFDRFAWKLGRVGLRGSYTDVSIAFTASHHKIPVLSFDAYFAKLAKLGFIHLIT